MGERRPKSRDSGSPKTHRAEHSRRAPQGAKARRGVLIVEDTAIVADEFARVVASLGHDVIGPVGSLARATEVVSALDDSDAPRIDLALLDVNLGDGEVYPVAKVLVARRVPIVFVTGYTCESMPPEFRSIKCLEKPFASKDLERTIQEALRMVENPPRE